MCDAKAYTKGVHYEEYIAFRTYITSQATSARIKQSAKRLRNTVKDNK